MPFVGASLIGDVEVFVKEVCCRGLIQRRSGGRERDYGKRDPRTESGVTYGVHPEQSWG